MFITQRSFLVPRAMRLQPSEYQFLSDRLVPAKFATLAQGEDYFWGAWTQEGLGISQNHAVKS
jgi:hypothetical protein